MGNRSSNFRLAFLAYFFRPRARTQACHAVVTCLIAALLAMVGILILSWFVFGGDARVESRLPRDVVEATPSSGSRVWVGNRSPRHLDAGVVGERPSGSSVSAVTLPWRPRYPWKAFFIALNLFNNAEVLPQLSLRLARFIQQEVAPFFDVAERVVISVFANGSTDSTDADVEQLLVPALAAAGVPVVRMHVVTNGSCCGGHARRPRGMDRIEWMACVRNAAMGPLYQRGLDLFSPMDSASSKTVAEHDHDQAFAEGVTRRTKHVTLRDGTVLTTRDAVVLFFNDIVFNPGDVTALLESGYAQDDAVDESHFSAPSGGRSSASSVPPWSGFDMACGLDFYVTLYDRWVVRGVDGRSFSDLPPYAKDRPSQRAFATANRLGPVVLHPPEGNHEHLSVPVRCCWNGLAVMRTSLFLDLGIRFRHPSSSQFNMSRDDKSCYSSECLLVCQDVLERVDAVERRPAKILVNPHVRVTYEMESFAFHREGGIASGVWFFRIVSLLRWWEWLPPDFYHVPPSAPAEWMECLLPADTLLLGSGEQIFRLLNVVAIVLGVAFVLRRWRLCSGSLRDKRRPDSVASPDSGDDVVTVVVGGHSPMTMDGNNGGAAWRSLRMRDAAAGSSGNIAGTWAPS